MTTPGSTPPVTPLTFSAYVRARGPVLLRTARSLTSNPNDAEDLLQTALAKTFVAWDRIEDHRALDGYVRRALINTRTSQWRRRRVDEHPVEELPEPEPVPEADAAERQALREAMWRAVLRLPPRQRAMVVLRYYEDLSEARTAEVLGVSVGTVKSAVSRAMARLRMDPRLAALATPEGGTGPETVATPGTGGPTGIVGRPRAGGTRRDALAGTSDRRSGTVVVRAA